MTEHWRRPTRDRERAVSERRRIEANRRQLISPTDETSDNEADPIDNSVQTPHFRKKPFRRLAVFRDAFRNIVEPPTSVIKDQSVGSETSIDLKPNEELVPPVK